MKRKIVLMLIVILLNLYFVNAGGGGAAVPITTIELTEQGNDYNIKPTRLKFEFDGDLYAVQVRRVKQEYVDFLVMALDMDKPNDITAYSLDNSFSLSLGERREIDIDKDGTNDIFIELNDIVSTVGSIRSADFSIKRIDIKKTENVVVDGGENIEIENTTEINILPEIIEVKIQKPIQGSTIASNQVNLEQSTFLSKIINFFNKLF